MFPSCRSAAIVVQLLLGTFSVIRADNNSANLSSKDLIENYEFLLKLGHEKSGIEMRGFGKCINRQIFLFNRPYIYIGFQELVYSPNRDILLILELFPERVVSYVRNEIFSREFCVNGQHPCSEVVSGMYFSVSELKNGSCVVVKKLAGYDDPRLVTYSLDGKLTKGYIDYASSWGVPFSGCTPFPSVRFLIYGSFRVQCSARSYPGFYFNCRVMEVLTKDMPPLYSYEREGANEAPALAREYLSQDRKQSKDSGKIDLAFGGCVNGVHFAVSRSNEFYLMISYYDGAWYNFYGYEWTGYWLDDSWKKSHELFQTKIQAPNVDYVPSTLFPAEPVSSVDRAKIISIYTNEPPTGTKYPFTGMPEETMTKSVTYLQGRTPKRTFFGKVILCTCILVFCVKCCPCLLFFMVRDGNRHRHYRYPNVLSSLNVKSTEKKKNKSLTTNIVTIKM